MSVRNLTKNHQFWLGFWCTYLRRIEFCVSKTTSTSNVRLQIPANHTPLTRNRGGGGVVITTASNPWKDRRSRARVRILARRFSEFRAPKNRLHALTSNPVKNDPKSTDFDRKSSLSACSLMHLPSACRFFVYEYRLEFWWKIINFGTVFDGSTFGVSIFSYQKRRQHYWRCWESQIEYPKF